jgi:purine-binding chemotaxis protein CheW
MTRRRLDRGPVDWDAIRAGLARASTETARTPERAKAIMDARARKLARRPQAPATAEPLALAVFQLASERYAIELRWIREVVRLTDYTPIPGTPDYLVGLTNLRGEIVAVVDLRRLFRLPTPGLSDLSRLVVLGETRREFGVLVDSAHGTTAISATDVLAAPAGVAGIAGACVRGVTRDAMIVLDGQALLADQRLVIDQTEGNEA